MHTTLDHWRDAGWELIAETPCAPALNLAVDEMLTRRVADGQRPPTLRFWGWDTPAIVLGRFQSVQNEVDLVVAREMNIKVVRRMSGGGAMFVQPERTITYSLYMPERLVAGWSIKDSYEACDRWAVESLHELGVQAWYVPLNDITGPAGKIGGAAQSRKPRVVLHHTTIAYELDNEEMRRLLRLGREKLSDKGIPSAVKHVSPLKSQVAGPRTAVVAHLIESFRRQFGLGETALSPEETVEAERLVRERYGTHEWTHELP